MPWGAVLHPPSDMVDVIRDLRGILGPEFEPLQGWSSGTVQSEVRSERKLASQRWWEEHVATARRSALHSQGSLRDQARRHFQAMAHCGDWLQSPLGCGEDGEIGGPDLRLALRWWLGLPILSHQTVRQPCLSCGDSLDCLGDHLVTCTKSRMGQ